MPNSIQTQQTQTISAAFRLRQMRQEIELAGLMSARATGNAGSLNANQDGKTTAVLDRVNALIDGARSRPH